LKTQLITLLFIFTNLITVFSQITAVTEKGDTIYVYNDGTWTFEEKDEEELVNELSYLDNVLKLDTITTKFKVGEKSTKEVTSQHDFFKVKYDKKVWKRVPPASLNPEAEFAFLAVDKDIYCMIISEEIEVGQENIVKIARKMMKDNTGGELEELITEQRNVNGTDIIRAVNKVEINGLNLVFDSYYYSGEFGTIQFSTWTGTNVHEKYEDEILELLNGLIITK